MDDAINLIKEFNVKANIENHPFFFLNQKRSNNENEDSLIIYTFLNNKNILLMGDAGISSEDYFISAYNISKVDILKVGHHGLKGSSSEPFLQKRKPIVALILAAEIICFIIPMTLY